MLCVIRSTTTVTRRLIKNISLRWVCTPSSYPRKLTDCEEDPFEDDMQFSLLVEGVQVCTCGDLVTAFALMFATYYIYNLSYPDAIEYYDLLSNSFFQNSTWCKKGIQSVKINNNLTECSNLQEFQKFVQIAKQSNDKWFISKTFAFLVFLSLILCMLKENNIIFARIHASIPFL